MRPAALALLLTTLLPPAAGAAEEGRWVHLGPFGGPVADIAVAPSAPQTLYAATDSGVYRSENAGARWRPARTGPAFVAAVAVDPSDARVVYAGQRHPISGPMVHKSVDGGVTWAPLDLLDDPVAEIAIDPRDPSCILVAGDNYLYLSTDGGETWDIVHGGSDQVVGLFAGVAFAPEAPGVAYAVSRNLGFSKSTDGGVTWTSRQQGLPASGFSQLGVSPSGALYVTPLAQHPATVFRSLDQGESWSPVGSISGAAVRDFGFLPDGSPNGFVLFAGTDEGIFRKNVNGPGWTRLRPGQREDVQTLAADPADPAGPGTLYAGIGLYGGLRGVLKSADGGATWRPSNRGLAGEHIVAAVIAPSDPRVIYASVGNAALVRSSNGGASWSLLPNPRTGVRIYQLAVDPRNANVVSAAGGFGGFWRSTDGGRSWKGGTIEDGECVFPTSLTLEPRHPDRLLLAGVTEVGCQRGGETSCLNLETSDGGATWTCLEGVREDSSYALVADPRRPRTLYKSGFHEVLKSTDGGRTWAAAGDLRGAITTLVISPQGTLWAGGSSVFRSRDGGRTWRQSGRGLPGNASIRRLVLAPSNPSILYASVAVFDDAAQTESYDLYRSTNAGVSWSRLPEEGLPVPGFPGYLPVLVDPRDPGRIYAGTQLGLHRLDGALD